MTSEYRQRPFIQRQRALIDSDIYRTARYNTYSYSPYSFSYRRLLSHAGFSYCIVNRRVICICCGLICDKWNEQSDDPCEVHERLKPRCPFVKSMSCCHPWRFEQIIPSAPKHIDYTDKSKRLESFPFEQFSLKYQLAHAGFFCENDQTKCFYCDGSYEYCQSNKPPLAEHIRLFPFCPYARNLCGEDLFHKIQQSIESEYHAIETLPDKPEPILNTIDRSMRVYLLGSHQFSQNIVSRCQEEQCKLRYKNFDSSVDLLCACQILQKQEELTVLGHYEVVIPSVELQHIYENRARLPIINSAETYEDRLQSFDQTIETHAVRQSESHRQFIENENDAVRRERSFHKKSENRPTKNDLFKGGWLNCDTNNGTTQCLYCHVQYFQWKTGDNPLAIHQSLAPLCPFVLSSNPLTTNEIQKIQLNEYFTDEVIQNAASQPYNGLTPAAYDDVKSMITNRLMSFDAQSDDIQLDVAKWAKNGLCYNAQNRTIECFYCGLKISGVLYDDRLRIGVFNRVHWLSSCMYIKQLKDRDPVASTCKNSTQCTWCMSAPSSLVALPCRHLCLCLECSKIKRFCPKCDRSVTSYGTVYCS